MKHYINLCRICGQSSAPYTDLAPLQPPNTCYCRMPNAIVMMDKIELVDPQMEGDARSMKCSNCDGTGRVEDTISTPHTKPPKTFACPKCNGSGEAEQK